MRSLILFLGVAASLAVTMHQARAQEDETPWDARRRAYLESRQQAEPAMDARRERHRDDMTGKAGQAGAAVNTAMAAGAVRSGELPPPPVPSMPWMPKPENIGVGLTDAGNPAPSAQTPQAQPSQPQPPAQPATGVPPQPVPVGSPQDGFDQDTFDDDE